MYVVLDYVYIVYHLLHQDTTKTYFIVYTYVCTVWCIDTGQQCDSLSFGRCGLSKQFDTYYPFNCPVAETHKPLPERNEICHFPPTLEQFIDLANISCTNSDCSVSLYGYVCVCVCVVSVRVRIFEWGFHGTQRTLSGSATGNCGVDLVEKLFLYIL